MRGRMRGETFERSMVRVRKDIVEVGGMVEGNGVEKKI